MLGCMTTPHSSTTKLVVTNPAAANTSAAKTSPGKIRVVMACIECGATHPKWSGQCSTCGAWNSIVEESIDGGSNDVNGAPSQLAPPVRLDDVPVDGGQVTPTGLAELDRVLGGGIVPGSVTLLGGEPGIGKSTLVLQVASAWPSTALYVSAEESQPQVKTRAQRLGDGQPHVWIAAETSLRGVMDAIDRVEPTLVIVDSIQSI